MVNQISVFLENRRGRVLDLTRVLADNNIDLVNMVVADTKEFGILRAVTSDNKKAVEVLKAAGFTVAETDLIGVEVPDRVGGLREVLEILDGVDIEYTYSYAKTRGDVALILFKVGDVQAAVKKLNAHGVKLL